MTFGTAYGLSGSSERTDASTLCSDEIRAEFWVAECARKEAQATVRFLAQRLVGKAGARGRSSDAMLAAAAIGATNTGSVRPHDLGDFGRCCEVFALAPYKLRERMLPILAFYAATLRDEATRTASERNPRRDTDGTTGASPDAPSKDTP